jgi:hypothetical protein
MRDEQMVELEEIMDYASMTTSTTITLSASVEEGKHHLSTTLTSPYRADSKPLNDKNNYYVIANIK